MKVKDLERTANVAWSPANQHPILLAAGTAAQQLDASFNTNASLEIYALNLSDPASEMELRATVPSEHRFHKIIWGPYSGSGGDYAKGTIVGGCDGGVLQIYNVQKLVKGEDGLVSRQDKHSGPVHSVDFNPFQANLLATGASESEIYIWDLNNTSTPMSPGAKSQPLEDVLSIAWNRQVQHILASTFTTKCVVWDLRKNEPIIKLSDTVSRIRWKMVAWHPEVATQLCLASEDDQAPVIQLWDLRFATSPLKTLESHQRGVLSLAWCSQDPDLLVSCGKDNRIICWNPNSSQQNGEVLSEIAKTNQWSFDVAWCPKNPALIASPSFDGHVSIYSLMGGKAQQIQTTNKIADSFPGMDGYVQAPILQQTSAPVSADLSKPPKWLKRPVGAVFGFGGKLITFENEKVAPNQAQQNQLSGQMGPTSRHIVTISQVITEPELVRKSMELEEALEYGNFKEYCLSKADMTSDQHKKYIWHFIKAQFEENSRLELLNLLGYKINDVNEILNEQVGKYLSNEIADEVTDQFANLNNRHTGYGDGDDFNAIERREKSRKSVSPYTIKTGNDTEGRIAQALILGNVEAAVALCFDAKRFADAVIIAMTGGSELLARTQQRYLQQCDGYLSSLISALVSEDWVSVINNCDINSWKEALAAALTHSSDEELPLLCEQMGNRLEKESSGNKKLSQDAQLCYICAGSFNKLVGVWCSDAMKSTDQLQELVELVTFLRKAIERQGRQVEITGNLAELLSYYASLLASQGNLQIALNYLGSSQNEQVSSLRERLCVSLGLKATLQQAQQQHQPRRTSMRQSFTSYFGQTNQPAVAVQNSNFNAGLPGSTINQQPSWQQPGNAFIHQQAPPPPKTFSPAPAAPPPMQPPRPTSVGSAHGSSSGLPSRSKYVLDPSVQSNPYGSSRNQYGANPMLPPQPQPNFQSNHVPNSPPVNTFAPFVPNSAPAFVQQQPAPISGMSNTMNPGFPANVGYTAQNPGLRNEVPPPPTDVGQSALNYLPANTAPGWNDPPVFNKPLRLQQNQDFVSQDPITHPLYGATPAQNLPTPNNNVFNNSNNNNGYYNQSQPLNYGQPPPNQPFSPSPAHHSQGSFAPGGFNTQAVMNPAVNAPPPQQRKPSVVEKPAPVQKAPIPEEHIHMQTVFDELRSRCSCAANNQQTKRKLEDVSKKLEALYDLLREHKLSQGTLTSLHQMVQLVQNGDYAGGLQLHTQMVSGQDFSQIASFMPGLKVLLQCALQLQVYLR